MAPRPKQSRLLLVKIKQLWFGLPISSVDGVTALPDIVAIPGAQSRIVRGLIYVMGQIMTVIDIAPVLNTGTMQEARDAVAVHYQGEFFALCVSQVGTIIESPPVFPMQKPLSPAFGTYIEHEKRRVMIIDIAQLVENHVCN